MINKKTSAFFLGIFLALYIGASAMAADTEIYDGTGNALTAPPLVMFVIDYSPSVLSSAINCTVNGLSPIRSSDGAVIVATGTGISDNQHYGFGRTLLLSWINQPGKAGIEY